MDTIVIIVSLLIYAFFGIRYMKAARESENHRTDPKVRMLFRQFQIITFGMLGIGLLAFVASILKTNR